MKAVAVHIALLIFLILPGAGIAQETGVWVSDNGDGTYTNPVLYADYSDPDVVKHGDDFYMTASSFNVVPGLPILHSKDLVNWTLINHALPKLYPVDHYKKPQHGNGVWAPSIRIHKGEFYIFWGDPDFGIFMVKTKDPAGVWSKPHLVKEGKGLIDPTPLWDEDGKAYLVHAFARSRSGINSILVVQEMKPDASAMIGDAVLAFDGMPDNFTVEGPKFYKYGDTYYILAPAGGVRDGWQLALRSKDPFGPYHVKKVLHQGSTDINGPHQGGLVELESGESWFLHFQELQPYGRVVHLNPVHWEDGWPLMGVDSNNDGIGEPVSTYKKPDVTATAKISTPSESDDFDKNEIGNQWQWHANPELYWGFPHGGVSKFRLFSTKLPEDYKNYYDVPHLLLQKLPAPEFTVTTKLNFVPDEQEMGEETGLIVMGRDYSFISIVKDENGFSIQQKTAINAYEGRAHKVVASERVGSGVVWFKVDFYKRNGETIAQFCFSLDGKEFKSFGSEFKPREGRWIGSKVGIFASRPFVNYQAGFTDFEWFKIDPLISGEGNDR